jgi:dTDP-4-amino-4,6-dideoxygalactose transaminase
MKKMNVKFLDLPKQNKLFKKEFMEEVSSIVDSGSYAAGDRVKKFEEDFSEYCDVKYCVATSSGTAALHAALACFKVEGDVVTPPNSFIATSEAVSYMPKLRHKFIDVDKTGGMDAAKAETAIEDGKTKIVMPVSLYGNPCNLVEYARLCQLSGKFLVHDAAQAHGAEILDTPISWFSLITCFSFYPGKNLGTCGEGGAAVTNSKVAFEYMKAFINHGQSEKYKHEIVGNNYRMSEIEAAALNIKLKYINEWTDKRIRAAKRYTKNLSGHKKIQLLKINPDNKCVYHLFPVFISHRDKVAKKMLDKGVQTGIHYPIPIHLQKAYKNLNHKKGDFPESERQARREISLPIYPEITNNQIDYVSECLINSL